jgi:hypothetical protein
MYFHGKDTLSLYLSLIVWHIRKIPYSLLPYMIIAFDCLAYKGEGKAQLLPISIKALFGCSTTSNIILTAVL